MSILNKIMITESGAPRITVYGKPGIGKSTFASTFPKPLFLLTENPELPNINALPVAKSFSEIWENVKQLLAIEDFPFETIVLDSISKLDALVISHILENEPDSKSGKKVTTLAAACGGYGAGFARAQSIHRAFKTMMDRFKDKGVAIVYISHSAVIKHKSPDSEDYDIYSIVMNHDKSREIYIDDVDAVLFCKLRAFVTENESGRAMVKSTGDRIIVAGINESHVSKNRFGIDNEIPMTFEALAKNIPFYTKDCEE
jgi:hypothetical protein